MVGHRRQRVVVAEAVEVAGRRLQEAGAVEGSTWATCHACSAVASGSQSCCWSSPWTREKTSPLWLHPAE